MYTVYTRTCNKPPDELLVLTLEYLHMIEGIRHFYQLNQFTAPKYCLRHTVTHLDFSLSPAAPLKKDADGLQHLTFHDTKQDSFSMALKSQISLGKTMFPPTASRFPLTTSRAHFRSTRHLPVLCWVSFFAQFLISHLLRELQKHTKTAAVPWLLRTCSSVSNCCQRRCPEVAGDALWGRPNAPKRILLLWSDSHPMPWTIKLLSALFFFLILTSFFFSLTSWKHKAFSECVTLWKA